MSDERRLTDPGYELLREKERLEKRQPDLVRGYKSFLRDFAQYLDMEKQFGEQPEKPHPGKPAFAARLK